MGLALVTITVPLNYVVYGLVFATWVVYGLVLERTRKKKAPIGSEVGHTFNDRSFPEHPEVLMESLRRHAKAEEKEDKSAKH